MHQLIGFVSTLCLLDLTVVEDVSEEDEEGEEGEDRIEDATGGKDDTTPTAARINRDTGNAQAPVDHDGSVVVPVEDAADDGEDTGLTQQPSHIRACALKKEPNPPSRLHFLSASCPSTHTMMCAFFPRSRFRLADDSR